jgi:hypothetical protein
MSLDQVGQLTKHLSDTMQKEFDLLNKEMNLDEKYYTKNINSNGDLKSTTNGSLVENVNTSDNINKSIGSLNNLSSNSLVNDDLLTGESLNNTNKSIVNDDNNNSIHEEETKKEL